MPKYKVRRVFLVCLLLAVMGGIFYFSAQTAEQSIAESDVAAHAVMQQLDIKEMPGVPTWKIEVAYDRITDFVRNSMHFLEYFLLSVISFFSFRSFKLRNAGVLSVVLTSLFAITDEVHQIFVEGRGASLSDWFLDCMGAIVGVVLVKLVLLLDDKRKKKKSKKKWRTV